jgi:hypothetical protein
MLVRSARMRFTQSTSGGHREDIDSKGRKADERISGGRIRSERLHSEA